MSRMKYSEWVRGSDGNYHWPARFDWTPGFLGITQRTSTPDNPGRIDRVLLSRAQVKALLEFLPEYTRLKKRVQEFEELAQFSTRFTCRRE